MMSRMSVEPGIPHIAIIGNPNCGKSTIFNALTGLRQKTSNYPGVTVEKHEGRLNLEGMNEIHAIDLPGIYSLNPRSADEAVAHDVLLGLYPDTPEPELIVAVADASTLKRSLFLVLQLLGLGKPLILVLNMMDICRRIGMQIDHKGLSRELGIPVIPMVAQRREGIRELENAIAQTLRNPETPKDPVALPDWLRALVEPIRTELVAADFIAPEAAEGEALRLLCTEGLLSKPRYEKVRERLEFLVRSGREKVAERGATWWTLEAELRYQFIDEMAQRLITRLPVAKTWTERLDVWLLHPVLGSLALAFVLLVVFVAIFNLAQYPMDWIETFFGRLAEWTVAHIAPGPLQDMLTQGVIAGVGGVLTFLPQIMLLFLFIAIMEDSGYAARIAFLLDHLMARLGLHGKAFMPLFSSFACAIPGVMATRVIDNEKDRLVTILVSPFMCCAARWPVYLLLAGTVIPSRRVLGFLPLPALVLGGLVFAGILAAVLSALLFNKTLLRTHPLSLALDLPRYRVPQLRTLLYIMWERSFLFVRKAGTLILAVTIIMWALAYYPRKPELIAGTQIEYSFAGRIGHWIEPAIRPIGFDWRIGVAVLSSLVAREVFVSSIVTIFEVQKSAPESAGDIIARLQSETDPVTGRPFFTPLRGISIMLFYVLAMQCLSTVAVVRRETGGWRWPLFQWFYMTGLAWLVCFLVWQIGSHF